MRFLRHPKPVVDSGICYGQTDLALVPGWEAKIERVAQSIPRPKVIFTSPLQRCAEPCDYLAAYWGVPSSVDHRLQEMDFGSWEGMAWDDVPRGELDEWARDFFHARPHGGESVAHIQKRVESWLQDVTDNDVLAVTHLGVIRCVAALTGLHDPWTLKIGFADFHN